MNRLTNLTKYYFQNGGSIVDFLKSEGLSSDKAARKALAKKHGFKGDLTAADNIALLNYLKAEKQVPINSSQEIVNKPYSEIIVNSTTGEVTSIPNFRPSNFAPIQGMASTPKNQQPSKISKTTKSIKPKSPVQIEKERMEEVYKIASLREGLDFELEPTFNPDNPSELLTGYRKFNTQKSTNALDQYNDLVDYYPKSWSKPSVSKQQVEIDKKNAEQEESNRRKEAQIHMFNQVNLAKKRKEREAEAEELRKKQAAIHYENQVKLAKERKIREEQSKTFRSGFTPAWRN